MVAGPLFSQNGCVAYRRIGAHDAGQGIKSRLIYKEDSLPLCCRPFLMAGQVSSRQCAIAASSR
jgi:hypothetical protein